MSNSDLTTPLDATGPTSDSPVPLPIPEHARPITLRTVGLFLLGNRDAILALAGCRETLWLGMIFVFSAAFAREYDGEDLLYEPWHLLLPLVASLVTSFLLFGLMSVVGWFRHVSFAGFWSRYRIFLGLYWMSAPLAWLYGIPVERFLSAGDATSTNLTFLACVSLWRVILITRVLSVLFTFGGTQAFWIVMLFADSVALFLMGQVDVQIFVVMGGVRLTESEMVLANAKTIVMLLGTLSWPVWFLGALILAAHRGSPWKWGLPGGSHSKAIPRRVWSMALVSVLVWLIPLPWTQGEQQLRGAVERAFRSGRYDQMLALMSAHQRDEFPTHWDPPPRIGAMRERGRIVKVVQAFSTDTTPWVRALFCHKLRDALGRNRFPEGTLWSETDRGELLKLLDLLPESAEILKGKEDLLQHTFPLDGADIGEIPVEKLSILLMKAAVPPDESVEYPGDAASEWTWNHYLKLLENVKDKQLVRKFHGTHLRRLLANPTQIQSAQYRMKALLSGD